MAKINVYKDEKLLLSGEKIYELSEDINYIDKYSGLKLSDYEIEFEGCFRINLPLGYNFTIEKDGSGVLLSPVSQEDFLNMLYFETVPQPLKENMLVSDLQKTIHDEFLEIIEEEGGDGVIRILNVGNITVSYILTDLSQFKFSINNKENIFKGYGFDTKSSSYKESLSNIEAFFSSVKFPYAYGLETDSEVNVDQLFSNYYHSLKSGQEDYLNVFLTDDYFEIDNLLRIPRFKNFEVLQDIIKRPDAYTSKYEVHPLILTSDINHDFSSFESINNLSAFDWIIFEGEYVKKEKKEKPNYRANYHKLDKTINNLINDVRYSRRGLKTDKFKVNDLEFSIITTEDTLNSIVMFINGGSFMYVVNINLQSNMDKSYKVEAIKEWVSRITRVNKLES